MKSSYKLNTIMLVIFLVLAGFIASCEGPQGPAGKDGSNGKDGATGTAVCGTCHNETTNLIAKVNQYELSTHATGGAFVYANRVQCATCHNTEGFLETNATGADTVAQAFANPSTINCRTCHKIHQKYDATDWEFTYKAPYKFKWNGGVFTADLNRANLCGRCHQARKLDSPALDDTKDTLTISSMRWGPHHSGQSNTLLGYGAYSLDGTTLPTQQAHQNISTGPCFKCHMAGPSGHMTGGHSFQTAAINPETEAKTTNSTGCIGSGCHQSMDAKWNPDGGTKATDMWKDMLAIRGALAAKGWLDTTSSAGQPANDLLVASAKKPLKLYKQDAKCVMNYLLLATDHSMGIHNPKYASAVLRQCKTYLGL